MLFMRSLIGTKRVALSVLPSGIHLASHSERKSAQLNITSSRLTPKSNPCADRLRQQAWLFVVFLQDTGMRSDEVFPMRIENIYWDQNSGPTHLLCYMLRVI
jgi:hypothetical protein